MSIDYKKLSLEELDKLAFHHTNFDFVCDADRKVIIGDESFSFSVGDETQENTPKQIAPNSCSVKEIKSPIVGTITAVLVQNGQVVQKGEPLFTIEVMKMETQIKAQDNMTVAEVLVVKGAQVTQGQVLARSV